ncbi:hypothetical protein JKP88DRAFT_262432 [Tribonema minus]|uniref:SET domain-containing protein n=1 Tax=Tribonema minus TaxID=303371 RepID=A0A835Z5W0_9STRA|nr:hypothetical protein JKP88DRAFT_262432 [Tribonema minus]
MAGAEESDANGGLGEGRAVEHAAMRKASQARAVSVQTSATYRAAHRGDINAAAAERLKDGAQRESFRIRNAMAARKYRATRKLAIKERRATKRKADTAWAAKERARVAEARRKQVQYLDELLQLQDCGAMGKGIVAKCQVRKGTVIPLTTVALRKARKQDRSYQVDSSYISVNSVSWDTLTVDGVVLDAHPKLVKGRVEESWLYGSYINEATQNKDVNCELFPAPHNTAYTITAAHREDTVLVGALVVVAKTIEVGQQLLTHYGNKCGRDGYTVEKRANMPPEVEQFGLDVLEVMQANHVKYDLTGKCKVMEFGVADV